MLDNGCLCYRSSAANPMLLHIFTFGVASLQMYSTRPSIQPIFQTYDGWNLRWLDAIVGATKFSHVEVVLYVYKRN